MTQVNLARFRKGALASVLGMGVRILTQILQVPFLFANWPTNQVSAWLLIWTLPSYMVLTVSAFSMAGGTMVVAAAVEENLAEARAAFRATGLAILGSTFLLAVAVIAGFPFVIDLTQWGLAERDVMLCLIGAAAYVAVMIAGSRLQAVYRYGGDYGGYGFVETIGAAVELVVTLSVVLLSKTIWILPLALTVVRLAIVAALHFNARRRWPELFQPVEQPRVNSALKAMFLPFLGFMNGPLILLVTINGYAMLVSKHFGPVLFAMYLTVRTLVRLADSAVNVGYSLLSLELSYVRDAAGEERLMRLLSGVAVAGFIVTLGYLALILLFGQAVQHAWTTGKVGFSYGLAVVFGSCVVLRAAIMPFTAFLASRNRHVLPDTIYLVLVIAGFGMSVIWAAMGRDLVEVVAWQVLAEVLELVCTTWFCARHMGKSYPRFIIDVLRHGPETAWQIGKSVLARKGLKLDEVS